ncbi:MAG: response regulator transcription factor [Collinsella sp.]|nr:response regulator transcription factor [Collinsella sp.]
MAGIQTLIVEDDADINGIVATRLARCGHSCTQAFSGTEARMLLEERARSGNGGFDLVICDLMLPGMPGEGLVKMIRESDASIPVIVTSAKTAISDRVDLLKLGADDYLVKPFDLDELVARVEVQLRHRGRSTPNGSSPTFSFGRWLLDVEARTLTVDGNAVDLTRIEFNIMSTLMTKPGRVWSKRALFEAAWGEAYSIDDNTVTVHVSNIRTKLRPSSTDGYIKTVWGMGFKLVDEL